MSVCLDTSRKMIGYGTGSVAAVATVGSIFTVTAAAVSLFGMMMDGMGVKEAVNPRTGEHITVDPSMHQGLFYFSLLASLLLVPLAVFFGLISYYCTPSSTQEPLQKTWPV